jgi:hypothetical protein
MPANEQSGAQKMFGDFAPALVHFTDDVLFAEAWARTEELSARDRSLITVASLLTSGSTEQIVTSGSPATTAPPSRSSSRRSPTWRSTPGGPRRCPR